MSSESQDLRVAEKQYEVLFKDPEFDSKLKKYLIKTFVNYFLKGYHFKTQELVISVSNAQYNETLMDTLRKSVISMGTVDKTDDKMAEYHNSTLGDILKTANLFAIKNEKNKQ